jgi:hypothetical protein
MVAVAHHCAAARPRVRAADQPPAVRAPIAAVTLVNSFEQVQSDKGQPGTLLHRFALL